MPFGTMLPYLSLLVTPFITKHIKGCVHGRQMTKELICAAFHARLWRQGNSTVITVPARLAAGLGGHGSNVYVALKEVKKDGNGKTTHSTHRSAA